MEITQIQKDQIEIYSEIWKKQRRNFGYADVQQYVAESKNNDDLLLLSENVGTWAKMTQKKPEQKKLYENLFLSVMRVRSYCLHLQTTVQHSVALLIDEKKKSETLESKIERQKLEFIRDINEIKIKLQNAEAEIEFIKKNR